MNLDSRSLGWWRTLAALTAIVAGSTAFALATPTSTNPTHSVEPQPSISNGTGATGHHHPAEPTPQLPHEPTTLTISLAGQPGAAPLFDVGGNEPGNNNPANNNPVSDEVSPLAKKSRDAVAAGLEYLSRTQQANGSWINDAGYKLNYDYKVVKPNAQHPGVTAIACLAFMAGGHYPGRGRYGENVKKGLDFVLSCVTDQGAGATAGFITRDETRMYSHAFATLFLAEVLGMSSLNSTDEKRVREKLAAAVHMIVQSQNAQGAWRYAPNATDSDMSIAVCQLQALRAARNVGLKVPPSTIEAAKKYIRDSYSGNGQFLYQAYQMDGSRATWTLTAAGVCALQQAGSYDSFVDNDGRRRNFKDSIDHLFRAQPISRAMAERKIGQLDFSFFYGYYYATQAVYQYSREHPETWGPWLNEVRVRMIPLQYPDGSWRDMIGNNYATAMAALVLQIHQEYLPIFQK